MALFLPTGEICVFPLLGLRSSKKLWAIHCNSDIAGRLSHGRHVEHKQYKSPDDEYQQL